jgi:tRNA (uracil-5-)-methyltransferase TRM9
MDLKICTLLADLNSAFYATFADDFARTRRGWPPGFDLILSYLPPGANVLDLGCGNGRFLAFLAARGWRGSYLGMDNDSQLLSLAREVAVRSPEIGTSFVRADLMDAAWPAGVAGLQPDRIACLAVLHHIPGRSNRERFIAACAALLPPAGMLILSTWQFMSAERLRSRILPWAAVGLESGDVEPGDYLLAWGKGASGQRYCASIGQAELCTLAAHAGLTPVESFSSDGKEGNLNLYGIFVKRDA